MPSAWSLGWIAVSRSSGGAGERPELGECGVEVVEVILLDGAGVVLAVGGRKRAGDVF